MSEIKIAFFDIDGTLVSFNSHRIPSSALIGLNTLTKNGIEIVIATGRAAQPIPEIKEIHYSAIIGLNGAECALRDGTQLYHHSIPETMFKLVLEMGKRYDFAIAAEFKEGFVVDRVTPRVEEMAARIASPCPPVRNLRALFEKEGTGQMCIFTDPETERKVMEEASRTMFFKMVRCICRHKYCRNRQRQRCPRLSPPPRSFERRSHIVRRRRQ